MTKKIFLIFILICLVLASLGGVVFFRHRQLCMYQSHVDAGILEHRNQENVCRNFLSPGVWDDMVGDVFRSSIQTQYIVAQSYDPETTALRAQTCDPETDPICWIKQLEGTLKQDNGFTNILIVGTDERSGQTAHGLTDTVIIASLDHRTGNVLLLSFPRDLLIFQENLDGGNEYIRINSLYSYYGERGTNALIHAMEQVIGQEIQYHVLLGFDTFATVVDALGGVEITLDQPLEEVFPRDELEAAGRSCDVVAVFNPQFCVVQFPAGSQTFDSTDALIYARARYLTSDFDRAARQQQIIRAVVRDMLADTSSLRDTFNTVVSLYRNVLPTVDTNVQVSDVTGLFQFVDAFSEEITPVVVDPSVGNGGLVYQAGVVEGFGDVIKFYDYTYSDFHAFIEETWLQIPYRIEQPRIRVVYASEAVAQESAFVETLGWEKLQSVTVTEEIDPSVSTQGIRVYRVSSQSVDQTIDALQVVFPEALVYDAEIDRISQSVFGEDLVVFVGSIE